MKFSITFSLSSQLNKLLSQVFFRIGGDSFVPQLINANDVNALINILMRQQHIENLNMILNPIDEISLSCHIFRCKTLVVLKLTFLSMHGCSSTIKLPSLKSLHLVAVDFGKPQDLKKLLYGLPILEDLKLHCIKYNEVDHGSFCKEEFKKLPKLGRADVLSWDDGPDFVPLEAICNVESLSISNNGLNQVFELDYFSYDEGDALASFPHSVPQCLTSHLTKCSVQYSGVSDELRFAKYIMQNSTTLRTMTICIDPFQGSKLLRREILEELALCPKISPLCELSVK